jgi:hypothetical protein
MESCPLEWRRLMGLGDRLKAAVFGAAQSIQEQREASTNPSEEAFRYPAGKKNGKKKLDAIRDGKNPDDIDQEDA